MILPIVAYGHPILKQIAQELTPDYPGLQELIANMFATMYASRGVGLAAPQVNKSVCLFIADARNYAKDEPEAKDFKKVFINPVIVSEKGTEWLFNEGCLSIPDIREEVLRKPNVHIKYYDENFVLHDEKYSGMPARIIQHEFDHLKGVLFIDKLSPTRRLLLKRRLNNIITGNIELEYKMIFNKSKKR